MTSNNQIYDIIEQYVTCRNDCTLRFMEALALNGLAVRAETEDCGRRHKRIILELIDGTRITSECRFDEEVNQSLRIINIYIGFARKNRAWEKLGIIEGKPEE